MNGNTKQLFTLFVAALLLCAAILVGISLSNDEPGDISDVVSELASQIYSESADNSVAVAENSSGEQFESLEPSEEPSEIREPFPAFKVDEGVKANYLVLYDMTNDEFLYERNPDKKCYPASITKLLTALTACDYLKPDDVVSVGSEINMIGAGSSTAYLQVGYKLTFAQLMDSMMIVSGNDAAYVMGVWAGRKILGTERGSREAALDAFMKAVNEKAKSLGMTSTHFSNPDGYHADDHYTTPRDIVRLCSAALQNELISEACAKSEARYTIVSGQTVDYKSTNVFLSSYEYATGLKTGTTNEAGFCLAASAEKDGRQLIAVIIGSDTTSSRFKYASFLFDLAYN